VVRPWHIHTYKYENVNKPMVIELKCKYCGHVQHHAQPIDMTLLVKGSKEKNDGDWFVREQVVG
jgi:hypothetical protein